MPSLGTPEIEPNIPLGMETTGRRDLAQGTLGWALKEGLFSWWAQLEGKWHTAGQQALGSQRPLGVTRSRPAAFEGCFYLAAI